MATKYYYSCVVSNDYLGKSKIIKAATQYELNLKAAQQREIYERQALAQMERDRVQSIKESAEFMNNEIQENLKTLENIFHSALNIPIRLDWDKMKRYDEFEEFTYMQVEPTLEKYIKLFNVPKPSILEKIFSSKLHKRLQLEEMASSEYKKACETYEKTKNEVYKKWESKKNEFENEKEIHNASIDNFKVSYENAEKIAVENYIISVLTHSEYPDCFPQNCETSYDANNGLAIISFQLPNTEDISSVSGYKYVASTKSIKEVIFKPKEFSSLYDDITKKTILRTVYEVFQSDYAKVIKEIVINGWVHGTDRSNGNDFDACIISLHITREKFDSINFDQIDVNECIKGLKAVLAGSLSQLAPITPIMDIDTNDRRFVDSRAIIDDIQEGDNLALMDWEDFEHLVRELFEKYFEKSGAEVRVTQSSRDGGVDAIAFDPDPIVGGKYVIQAKRYNRVVPVSAVRDLYGTMMNERAAKGILVTTSYFGSDSREFAKDKPISLINGSNLLALLSEYGYSAYIQLQSGNK